MKLSFLSNKPWGILGVYPLNGYTWGIKQKATEALSILTQRKGEKLGSSSPKLTPSHVWASWIRLIDYKQALIIRADLNHPLLV